MLWHSFTKFHTEMHLGWLQGPVDFQGQRSNNYVTRSQDRSNGYRGVKSISILSQYMQSYWFSKQSSINIIYNISVITITITMSIISANFGKYAISDCPFIYLSLCYHFALDSWDQVSSFTRITQLVLVQSYRWYGWNWPQTNKTWGVCTELPWLYGKFL